MTVAKIEEMINTFHRLACDAIDEGQIDEAEFDELCDFLDRAEELMKREAT